MTAGDTVPESIDAVVKRQAMDEAPVGITLTDPRRPDNPLVYCNAAFERITGYPREDVLGRNCRFLQGPDTDEDAVATLARGVAEEATVSTELVNYRRDGERFWNQVKIAPIRDDDGAVTHFVGFQMDVTDRKEAQQAVEREREALAHLLTRINGLLGDVTDAVVTAGSRAVIERRVVESVAGTAPYEFAWIGTRDLSARRVRPTAWHPSDAATEDALAVPLDDDTHPAVRALESGRIQRAESADAAVEGGSVVAVPLVYRSTTYGVLVVHAADGSLDDRETVVLEAIGRTVATAVSARESSRLLTADEVVEVELAVADDDLFFVALSERVDCTLDYQGAVARGDDQSLFFSTDADPEALCAVARTLPTVDAASVLVAETGLVEFRLVPDSVVRELADRGARTRTITATEGSGRIAFDLPGGVDARTVVQQFQDRYPASELVRYHEATRPPTTEREFVAELESSLTDRQHTALQTAFVSGYYDPDRAVTGDELADSMGITRSTFHQHLRAAERKLLTAVFDRDT